MRPSGLCFGSPSTRFEKRSTSAIFAISGLLYELPMIASVLNAAGKRPNVLGLAEDLLSNKENALGCELRLVGRNSQYLLFAIVI
jgi:hypothetical protein